MSSRPLPSSFDKSQDLFGESRWAKFSRHLKEEPLIPFGVALTCLALLQSSRSIRAGDKAQTNRWFRARIYAQGFTIAAMIGGSIYFKKEREEEKRVDIAIAERKLKEKQAAWIKELEIRDKEDQEQAAKARRYAGRKCEARAAIASHEAGETRDKP